MKVRTSLRLCSGLLLLHSLSLLSFAQSAPSFAPRNFPQHTFFDIHSHADFNNDGREDLLVLTATGTGTNISFSSSIILSNGDGSYGIPIKLTDGSTFGLATTAVADFNGD